MKIFRRSRARRKEILIDEKRYYALTCDPQGHLFLEVVIGGVFMVNMVIPLSDEEVREYSVQGKSFLDALSFRIAKESDAFKQRSLQEEG